MLHGYNPPHRYLPYLSWTEITELPDRENTVIVLPTGATEQHGPHLPCAVDTVISAGVVGHALARLPESVPAYAMAPITYGKSEEHLHFPGTMTLDRRNPAGHDERDRRVGLPRRFSQAADRQRPRRPAAGDGDGRARAAPAPRRLHRGAQLHLARAACGRPVPVGAREEARHARRPRRDRADAGAGPRHRAHGPRRHQLPARISLASCCRPTAARPAPGARATSAPAASSATRCPPPPRRARPSSTRWPTAGRRPSPSCTRCAGPPAPSPPGAARNTPATSSKSWPETCNAAPCPSLVRPLDSPFFSTEY